MNLPGFTSGEKSQNAVVAAMYFVALAAIVIVVVSVSFGGLLAGDGGNTTETTPQVSAGSADKTQAQPQAQSNSSGWVTVTSSGDSGSSNSRRTDSTSSTQIINENEVQLQVVRNTMANYSRVQLVSAEIRQNELYVRYTQDNMTRSGIITGAGVVTGTYLGLVGSGSDLEALNARLVDESGQVTHNFTVSRDFILKYNNGEISDSTYRREIVEDLQLGNRTSS